MYWISSSVSDMKELLFHLISLYICFQESWQKQHSLTQKMTYQPIKYWMVICYESHLIAHPWSPSSFV